MEASVFPKVLIVLLLLGNPICALENLHLEALQVFLSNYVHNGLKLDVITEKYDDFLNEFLKTSMENYCLRLRSSVTANSLDLEFDFTLMIAESVKSANDQLKRFLLSKNSRRHDKALVFIRDSSLENLRDIFNISWKFKIVKVFVIAASAGQITLHETISTPAHLCGDDFMVVTSRYLNGSWNKEQQKRSKQVINQCVLKVATSEYPPAVMFNKLLRDHNQLSGVDVKLVTEVAKILNFSVEFIYKKDFFGFVDENGTASGAVELVIKGDADLMIGFYVLSAVKTQFLSFTQPHLFLKAVIIIPPGTSFTPFEKLYRPFKRCIWNYVIISFTIGCFVRYFVRHYQNKFSNSGRIQGMVASVFGLTSLFLGSPQTIIPKSNFARIFVMTFILFTLIMRTLYTASLFLLLQSDQNHSEMSTVDELIDNEFDVYMYITFKQIIKDLRLHNR